MTGLNVNWEAIGEILALLFVISIVFETALTPIFNWRLFAKYFEGKGVKTPVTIAPRSPCCGATTSTSSSTSSTPSPPRARHPRRARFPAGS